MIYLLQGHICHILETNSKMLNAFYNLFPKKNKKRWCYLFTGEKYIDNNLGCVKKPQVGSWNYSSMVRCSGKINSNLGE